LTLTASEDRGAGFDVILGNPPFLNQLESATATARGLAGIVRARSGDAIRSYTDLSATFLLFSTHIVRAGGCVALVQPQSLLAVKDAEPVRRELLKDGTLESLWVSNEHVFPGVSVFTCAPTIRVGGPRRGPLHRSTTGAFTPLPPMMLDNDQLAHEETWAHLAAAASGIPEVTIQSSGTIADLADATADFRDQYYGLDGFLVEHSVLNPDQQADFVAFPPIITTGLIDLAQCLWGSSTSRILKTKWQAPRIDRERMIRDGTLGPWIVSRLVPKVLIATQTRVIEAFADAEGRFIPSVPVLTVTPKDATRLWHIAAALASPVCTALAMQKYAGAALNTDAIKLSAKQVLQLPLPSPSKHWDAAADQLRIATAATESNERLVALRRMAQASMHAFQIPIAECDTLLKWWWARLTGESVQEDADEHA